MKTLFVTLLTLGLISLIGCVGGKANLKERERLEKTYENIDVENVSGNWTNILNPSEVLTLWSNQRFELREVCWVRDRYPNSVFNRPIIRTICGNWEINGNNSLILKNIVTLDSSQAVPTAGYSELNGSIERNKKNGLRITNLRPSSWSFLGGEVWIKDT